MRFIFGSATTARTAQAAFLILTCVMSISVMTQSPATMLAPTGTLRAVFLSTNPVHARESAIRSS